MKKILNKMKAAVIEQYGGNEKVKLLEVDVPRLDAGDVLIQVKAASINPLDIRIRDGKLKQILPYKLPLILGNDFAGEVVEVGENVTKYHSGDEVYARCDSKRIGSFAEYVVVEEANISIKPNNLSMEEAASVPLVALTAWQILVEKGNVKKGHKVLIHGGAGGVGSVAIQLAKYLGAYVATTASKSDQARVKEYGADKVIDYRTEDFSTILGGYDLVLDTRGGETLEKSLHVLKHGGRVISINGTPDANMAEDLGLNAILKLVMTAMSFRINRRAKKIGVKYSFHFMRPDGAQLDELRILFERGMLNPVVDRIYSLQSIKEALAYSESGKSKGKIVIKI